MRGLLPSSMLDWPGKICSVLFLVGCNFRCPYCHNPELLESGSGGETISWEDLASYLGDRLGWIDGVSVTGGEPTIHGDLPELCAKLRETGMMVKVDTNGSRPKVLASLISEGLVDFVAMDLKTSLDRYPQVVRRPVDTRAIAEAIDTILAAGIEHEFRCTVVPGLVGFEDLESLARRAEGAKSLVLQQFNSENTLDPDYRGVKGYAEEVLLEWAERLSLYIPTKARGLIGASRD